MLVCFPAGENRVRFYFDSKADRDMFIKELEKLSGVVKVEGKENTRSLLVVYQKGSFAEQIINSLMGRKEVKGIGKGGPALLPFSLHKASGGKALVQHGYAWWCCWSYNLWCMQSFPCAILKN